VVPADAELSVAPYPKYSSPVPVGVSLGKVAVVDDGLEIPPLVSLPHTVDGPEDAGNSWAARPVSIELTLPENVAVMVEVPVVFTAPDHILRLSPVTLVEVAPAAKKNTTTATTNPSRVQPFVATFMMCSAFPPNPFPRDGDATPASEAALFQPGSRQSTTNLHRGLPAPARISGV
jgi:hypothetical protein